MTTITIERAVVEQALHVAENAGYPLALIKALRAALAQQAEPVPVAWMYTGIKQDGTEHGPHLVWQPEYMDAMSASKGAKATSLYTAPPRCPNCASLEAQNTELDRKLAELEQADPKEGGNLPPPLQEPTVAENATTQQQIEQTLPSEYRRGYWDGFRIGKREGRIEAEDVLAELAQQQAKPQGCDHCNHPLYAATKCRVCGRVTEQAEPVEPVAWSGYDLDGMVEAFSRVIEAHHSSKHPFHNPIDMDARMALRILRGFIPAMKAYAALAQQAEPTRSQQMADAGFTRRPSLWSLQARKALGLIAAPQRPDGTWNRDREACRQLAAEALGRYDDE